LIDIAVVKIDATDGFDLQPTTWSERTMIRHFPRGAVMESVNNPFASPEPPTHSSIPATVTSVPANQTASLVAVVADAVPTTNLPLRARLLQLLMIPIGPLAMTVLAGGAFAKYAKFARRLPIPISLEDAARVSSSQVAEIARYLEQSDPSVLAQVVIAISRDPTAMAALGATVAIAVKLASATAWHGAGRAQ
jgi:hypothetical protein